MFSLKFKGLGWRGNEVRYVMIVLSVALLVLQGVSGFAAIIALEIMGSRDMMVKIALKNSHAFYRLAAFGFGIVYIFQI